MDWYSRMVLAWRLSNSLGIAFCLEAIEEALANYPACEIFNSDQGSQFTSEDFTGRLLEKNILISMDSKGRALDNIIPERFFRSLKYEDVYLNNYSFMPEAKEGIGRYIVLYNDKRIHESLEYQTPLEIYGSFAPRANGKQAVPISWVPRYLERKNPSSNRILARFPKEKNEKFMKISKEAILTA
jgi:putative transposase